MSATAPNVTGYTPNPTFPQIAGATPSASAGAGLPGEATTAPPGNLTPAETALTDPPVWVKVLVGAAAVLALTVGLWALIGPDVESAAGTVAKAAA